MLPGKRAKDSHPSLSYDFVMLHVGLTAVTHPVTPNGRRTRCRGKPNGGDPLLAFFFRRFFR